MFKKFLKDFIDLIYPNVCLLCKKPLIRTYASSLCDNCNSQITKNTPPFCQKCGRQLNNNTENYLCPLCKKNKLHFQRAYSACKYEGEIKELIALFKYKEKISLYKPFAKILTDFIKEYKIPMQKIDIIMPIPLHNTRLREREYNQSGLLAKELAKEFNLHLEDKNLMRIKNTIPQVNLSDTQRWQNVKGAFNVKNAESIFAKKILLVDDLITTGATCSEASFALKENGAKEVYVLTLACA